MVWRVLKDSRWMRLAMVDLDAGGSYLHSADRNAFSQRVRNRIELFRAERGRYGMKPRPSSAASDMVTTNFAKESHSNLLSVLEGVVMGAPWWRVNQKGAQ